MYRRTYILLYEKAGKSNVFVSQLKAWGVGAKHLMMDIVFHPEVRNQMLYPNEWMPSTNERIKINDNFEDDGMGG